MPHQHEKRKRGRPPKKRRKNKPSNQSNGERTNEETPTQLKDGKASKLEAPTISRGNLSKIEYLRNGELALSCTGVILIRE